MKSLSLLWLRRDLRLHDHAALAHALKAEGAVQPVFIFDTDILARFSNPQDRRLTFIAEILCDLHVKLQKRGGGLLVLAGRATEIIPKFSQALGVVSLFATEDYEPDTRKRDEAVAKELKGAKAHFVKDHLLMAPTEVLRDNGPYKVFTPYSKKWLATLEEIHTAEYAINDKGRYADYAANVKLAKASNLTVIDADKGVESMLASIGYKLADLGEWAIDDGQKRLKDFVQHKINDYPRGRDMIAEEGTSKLSPYLRFGRVSVRECYREAKKARNSAKWIGELIWRDFYAMILFHYPETVSQEFIVPMRKLSWSQNKEHFKAYCDGMTGYPIVDAAMRQLKSIGWMHNRARMIVASFLTKDLHIDWRLGEEHFAQYLMDYELASNVGGWQWSASTGTDAQPWFRIFNPILQSKKFDPNGDYIRQWVPELRHMSAKHIHMPWKYEKPDNYPSPIVEHDEERQQTLSQFKRVMSK